MKKYILLFLSISFGTVTDIDGNVYETVLIGNQLWMAENLKVTHYNDGSEIPTGYSDFEWDALDDTETGAYAVCNDDLSNPYGNIYNWYAVDDSRGICPVGWHVPTDDEFKELEMFLGMSQEETDNYGYRGTNEGSKLAGNYELWTSIYPANDLVNDSEFGTSGFTGLPGGDRGTYGTCAYMGIYGDFWSSTEYPSDDLEIAWYRTLGCDYSGVIRYDTYKQYGFAVRCLTNGYILGDINGDEILNVLDIVLMINMILSNEYSVVADVNEDGSVDILDVVIMVNILVGGLP